MNARHRLAPLAVFLLTLSIILLWTLDTFEIAAQNSPITSTFQINSYVDDVNEVDSTYDEFATTAWIGTGGSATASYLGLRFTNITIPQGSTIVSAHFEMYSTQSQLLNIGYELAADASGNSLGFSSSARPSQRTLSTQKVSHSSNVQWVADTWYSSAEIKSIIQEVVNRTDWLAGNSLSLIAHGTQGTFGRKFFQSFDGAPLSAAKLVITYQPSSQAEPTPTPTSPPQSVGFQNSAVIIGLPSPTTLAFTPDGRMLIAERDGRIRVVQPGANHYDPLPFLQLTNIESLVGERSLIGLVLDPNFATNGHYYVFYTAQTPLRDRVSRFTAAGNTTNLATEVVLWQDDKESSDIHHGGGLLFGADGKLYISTGDGHDTKPGATHDSQNLTNFKGKVLRINRDGTVPTDNPFFDGAGPNYDEIWARGLRNPFRISYDSESGQIHIYDVGGGSFEEINIGVAGANYGWPICEGVCQIAGMTNPLFAYSHQGEDAAIGGGIVYRGNQFPAEYVGNLFYGDFVRGWIRRLTFQSNSVVSQDLPFAPPEGSTESVGSVVDFRLGPDGSLYYVDIESSIRKISYYSGNQPPVIHSVSATPTSGPGPTLNVAFDSTVSDLEANPLTYLWEFGDGSTATEADPSHTYANAGSFTARLTVSDGTNQTFSNPIVITVGTPPQATINKPADGAIFEAGDVIAFSGTATDPDETLPDSAYSWTIVFHHDTHVHPAYGPIGGIKSGTFTIPTTGHDYSSHTWYEIIQTVTDSDGIQDTKSVEIYPHKVNLTVRSAPPGIPLSLDQTTQSTPLRKDTLAKFEHTLTAPTQHVLEGKSYQFQSWSDGGTATHTITVPSADQTYVATYQELTTTDTSSITGTVFVDENRNGIQDSGERGHSGAAVSLVDTVSSTTTDNSGSYAFPNQPLGNYTVELTLPTGYVATTPKSVPLTLGIEPGIVNFGVDSVPTGDHLFLPKIDQP